MRQDAGPLSLLFDKQRGLVDDPAKFKAALCGRRGGKTSAAVIDFAHGMREAARSLNLFVALSIASAREIMWEPFKTLNEEHRWGFVFDESKMVVKHPNGSRLLVRGADDKRELEKLRGPKFTRIRIDECGAHRPSYLQYLVEEVLEATLMDCDGDVWLLGTCTTQAYGFFYEITTGQRPGYSVHRWTARDNPHVDFMGFVYKPETGLLARRKWTEDNPIFRREYLAEWVVESSRLVYRFERERNVVAELPPHAPGYDYILGLDFGYGDACAWSVIAEPRGYGADIYTVESGRLHGLAPSEFAPIIQAKVDRFSPYRIVGDVGGLGKAYAVEYTLRYGTPIEPANKADKRAGLEFVSDMLFTGRKKSLAANEDLHREWASLQWDELRKDVAAGQDDDVSDADMYASKASRAFLQVAEPEAERDVPAYVTADEDGPPERGYLYIPED